jgi:hypothetical protein
MGWSAASARQQMEYKRRTEEDPMEIQTIGIDLVPREHSTGSKQKLLGISKRGTVT